MTPTASKTVSTLTSPAAPSGDPAALLAALRALPFADYARVVATLLERLGYQDVRLLGPLYGKGRNAYGGFDLRAVQGGGLARPAVLGQIKQYAVPVPRCFVDELRGAMLRQGAQQGLLVSTSSFAPAATEAAQGGQHALPVRLVDGEELARLLAEHGVPVQEQAWSAFLHRDRAVWARRPAPGARPSAAPQSPQQGQEGGPVNPDRRVPLIVPCVSTERDGAGLTVTVTVRAPRQADGVSCR